MISIGGKTFKDENELNVRINLLNELWENYIKESCALDQIENLRSDIFSWIDVFYAASELSKTVVDRFECVTMTCLKGCDSKEMTILKREFRRAMDRLDWSRACYCVRRGTEIDSKFVVDVREEDFANVVEYGDKEVLDLLIEIVPGQLPIKISTYLSYRPHWLRRCHKDNYNYGLDCFIEDSEVEDLGSTLMDIAYNKRDLAQMQMIIDLVGHIKGDGDCSPARLLRNYLVMAIYDELEPIVYMLLHTDIVFWSDNCSWPENGSWYDYDSFWQYVCSHCKNENIKLMMEIATKAHIVGCGGIDLEKPKWTMLESEVLLGGSHPYSRDDCEVVYDMEDSSPNDYCEEDWDDELGQRYPNEGY